MSDKSSIEWTATVHPDGSVTPGATWNPVRGCKKVSPGCSSCYAETFAERWRGVANHPYEQGFDLRLVPEKLDEPLRWKKPRRVFVNSMSDLFQDGVPDSFIDQAFAVMALAPQHTFQLLTKRHERMRDYMTTAERWRLIARAAPKPTLDDELTWPLPNVWLGVSVENQHYADERIPLLLQTPAAIRFISAEPLLERIDIHPWRGSVGLSWVIVGGESGSGARPFDLAWARHLVSQCHGSNPQIPVFVKQLGAVPVNAILGPVNPVNLRTVGAIKDHKGGDMAEWPADLRVREFPDVPSLEASPHA